MFFGKKKRQAADKAREQQARDLDRDRKLAESQRALLNAALTTADTAQEVTAKLRSRLDDIVNQFDATSRLLKDALVICNILGEITAFNPAAERLFGIPHDEAIGRPVMDLFRKAQGNEEIADLATLWVLLKNEDQTDVIGANGRKRFPVQTSLSMLDRHDGSSIILLLVQDQSTAVMASRSERKYDSLFASSFDGVLVVYKGRIVAANPATTRLFGYPTEQLLNEPLTMLVHARDANRLNSSRLLPEGMGSPSQNFIIEGVHSSTQTLSLMFATTPIEWDNATALLITIKDVTELQRLESVLGVKRNSNGEMIVCFGTDYIVTFANKMFADVHGPATVGCDVRNILAPDQMAVFEANTHKLSSENSSVRSHTRHVRADGTVYFQDWIDNAVFDHYGNPVEYQRIGRTINDALSNAIRND